VERFEQALLEERVLTPAQRDEVVARARAVIEEALQQAQSEPKPTSLAETWGLFAGPHSRPIRRAIPVTAVGDPQAVAS
jgi:TPP-dependent pyruvate/acetoin dehydrogenase alpha subunit